MYISFLNESIHVHSQASNDKIEVSEIIYNDDTAKNIKDV